MESFEVRYMYLFDLGEKPWQQSMLIFHALARMGIEAIDGGCITVIPVFLKGACASIVIIAFHIAFFIFICVTRCHV